MSTISQAATRQFEAVKSDSETFLKEFDARLAMIPVFNQIQEKTPLKRLHAAGAIVGVAFLVVLLGVGMEALCNLVGFLYPVYASFKAIKTPGGADDTQWLTYWIVYGMFGCIESFVNLTMGWIPFYHLFKLGFLVWAFLPQTKGAAIVYTFLIEPMAAKFIPAGTGDLNVQRTAKKAD